MATIQHPMRPGQPEKGDAVIAFRCPPDLKKAARLRAVDEEISVQELCIRAIRLYLERKAA